MKLTDKLLILLIEVVIKTHDYENITEYKDRLAAIKIDYSYDAPG